MSTTPPPPPPPPEDPFPNFSNGDNPDPFANGDEEGLDQGRPEVAASPGRVMLVMGIVGVALLVLLYNIFFSGGDEEAPKPEQVQVAPPTTQIPPLPETVEDTPTAPPVFIPPTVPTPTDLTLLAPKEDGAAKERQQARIRSSMVVSDSGGGSGLGGLLGGGKNEEADVDDDNAAFGNKIIRANSKAERVTATHIGDLKRTIAQGRLIQAVTESAINTDLPAPIRAIVSRDVYPESGTEPLIPKGSRLIGQYNTQLMGGQSRVYVMWTRVIRPDGVDVMLGSPLVDQIGMAGVGGQVDTKFQQVFSRALMASIVTIAFAIGSDEVSGGDGQTSTTSSTFGTTQAGDGATTATVNALNRLGSTTDSFLRKFIDAGPTILVDQGTPVNVFVNRDLVFPAEFGGSRMIP